LIFLLSEVEAMESLLQVPRLPPKHSSSYIERIGYEEISKTLIIEFTSKGGGAVIAYKKFPKYLYLDLMANTSPGGFWLKIRHNYPDYTFLKV
jgi:hypothetical protein